VIARRRFSFLVFLMGTVAFGTVTVTLIALYRAAYHQTAERLVEEVASHAGLIAAIARFDAEHSPEYPGGSLAATLSQVREGQRGFQAFGRSVEFVIGRRVGDEIEFLLSKRQDVLQNRAPISFSSVLAEPMRRALNGESGISRGLDYRGEVVLAAYQAVPELGLGVVAKIDLAELRAPFERAAAFAAGVALLLVLIGGAVFQRVSTPLLREFETAVLDSAEAERVAKLGSYVLDLSTGAWTSSAGLDRLFGIGEDYPRTVKGWLELVHLDDRSMCEDHFTSNVLAEHGRFDLRYRIRPGRVGESRWVHGLGALRFDRDGEPTAMIGTIRDVTVEKAGADRLAKLARRAEALLRLPDLYDEMDEEAFLQRTLEYVEDLTESPISFFHRVNEAEGAIELITWSRRTIEHYCDATDDRHHPVDEAGIWADAVRRREPVVVNDYGHAAGQRGLPEGHAALESLATVPIIEGGEVVAIIGVGNKPSDYTPEDVETAQLFAQEAWQLIERGHSVADLATSDAIVNRSPAVAFRWRNEEGWPVEFVAENVERLLGYSAADFLSGAVTYAAVVHPDDLPWVARADRALVEAADPATSKREYRVVTKDGDVRWIEDHAWVVRSGEGEATHYEGVLLDITDRRAAEERLRDSERRVTLIFETVRDVLFYVAVEPAGVFRFEAVNEAFFRTTGLTWPEVIGKRIEEVIPEPSLHLVRSRYEEAIQGRTSVVWDEVTEYPAGIKHGVVTVTPIFDEEGRCDHLVGSVHDVTERRRVAADLQDSEHRFRTLFEQVPVSVWEEDFSHVKAYLDELHFEDIEDFPGYLERHPEVVVECAARVRVIDVNDAAVELHEAGSREELIDNLTRTFTAESFAAFRRQLVALARGEHTVETATEVRTLGGEIRHTMLRWVASPQVDPPWSRVVLSVSDVTELERTRREFETINAHLEESVEARTAELRSANEEMEGFAYSVSHDLKAPLRAIDGFSALLGEKERPALSEEGCRYLDTIRESTQRMASLIDDLLEFSHVGRADAQTVAVDMSRLAESVFTELMRLEGDREVEFSVSALPTVTGDPTLLRQVWMNLLGNAIKFSSGRAVARVEVDHEDLGAHVVFRIRDNGVGFDMAYVDKLFGVFQRLHYEDEFPGTGVGLATVRRIIQRHGGEIWAEGEVDRGATVSFRLPRRGE
jgi:PAS domain S-box-containing protein